MLNPIRVILFFNSLIKNCENSLDITDNSGINNDIFINLRRININLNDFGILCKGLCITINSVAETTPDCHQQICF